MHISTRTKIN